MHCTLQYTELNKYILISDVVLHFDTKIKIVPVQTVKIVASLVIAWSRGNSLFGLNDISHSLGFST